MAVIQLSAIILHCFIWYGCISSKDINKSGCEWLKMSGLQKTSHQGDGQFPICFFSNTSSTKTNAVCQREWQIDLMPLQNNPLMAVKKCCAVEENYYVNENNKGGKKEKCIALWFFQLWSTIQQNVVKCSGAGCATDRIIIHLTFTEYLALRLLDLVAPWEKESFTLCAPHLLHPRFLHNKHFFLPKSNKKCIIMCFSNAHNLVLNVHSLFSH